jgi:hypothetical protein
MADVSEMIATSIIKAVSMSTEAGSISETSVNATRRYVPEDNHFHIRRRENLTAARPAPTPSPV